MLSSSKHSKEQVVHGFKHTDPYFWVEAKSSDGQPSSVVKSIIESENDKTNAFFAKHDQLLQTIFQEIKQRRYTNKGESFTHEDSLYIFSDDLPTDADYPVRYITNKRTNKKTILLDENQRAHGFEYYDVMGLNLSPSKQYVAWVEDTVGDIRGTLHVRKIDNQSPIIHTIKDVSAYFVWGKDDSSIYYTKLDDDSRSYQIRHVDLNTLIDTEIFTENDESLLTYPKRMLSNKGIIVSSTNWAFSEAQAIWFDDQFDKLHMIVPREDELSLSFQHLDDGFYVKHSRGDEPFKLSTFDSIGTPRSDWETIYSSADGSIAEHEYLKDYIVVVERSNGADTLLKYHIPTKTISEVPVCDNAYGATVFKHQQNASSNTVRLQYESYFTPRTVIDIDLDSGKVEYVFKPDLKDFNPADYVVDRVEIPSHDGALVPATIIKRKDLPDGPNPVYQYVYGGYGVGIPPEFPSFAFSLIDRGFIYVVSHVRGGDEKGDSWHEGGRLLNRKNTFHDFAAITNYLIDEGITEKGDISISGESAAGRIVGTITNQYPGTYRSVTVLVPAFDLLNKLLNPDLLITKTEWSEYGNPIESKEYFEYIRSYSPMENLKEQAYPASYMTGAYDDPAVGYYEPLKWTLAVRDHNTDNVDSFVHIRPGGHVDNKAGGVQMEFSKQMVFMLVMHDRAGPSYE